MIPHSHRDVPWLGGQAIHKTSALEPHKPLSLMLQPQESKQQAHARTHQQEKGQNKVEVQSPLSNPMCRLPQAASICSAAAAPGQKLLKE